MATMCPKCNAEQDYLDMRVSSDDMCEYAAFTCGCCGWEWEDVYWNINESNFEDALLPVGMM